MQQVCENDSLTLLSGLIPFPKGDAMKKGQMVMFLEKVFVIPLLYIHMTYLRNR